MRPEDHDPKRVNLDHAEEYPGIDIKIVDEKNNEVKMEKLEILKKVSAL